MDREKEGYSESKRGGGRKERKGDKWIERERGRERDTDRKREREGEGHGQKKREGGSYVSCVVGSLNAFVSVKILLLVLHVCACWDTHIHGYLWNM